jgi:hypothetical protein
MAYTTIDDPSAHRHTQLYTGDGNATQAITNDANSGDFKPDWLWLKRRTAAEHHMLADSTRGAGKRIRSNSDDAEDSNGVTSFNTDGFTTLSSAVWNQSSSYYVAWQWKANGGTTSSNNDGSYTSTVQANTTAGFSIVKYGDATSFSSSSPATVGHGLGKAPKWILIKNLDGTRSWGVHHVSNGAGKIMYLDLTNGVASSTGFDNGTLPSSTVFTVNTLNVANGNNLEYIAYCFADIQGYSKFGSYTGTASADGPFVYTGFKPAWVMIRNTEDGEGWMLHDSKVDDNGRNDAGNVAGTPGNTVERRFQVNETQAEVGTTNAFDFLSNGFKLRTDTTSHNGSGHTIIYMAFAEHPFVSSKGVPTTAR